MSHSFKKGFNQVQAGVQKQVRRELMEVLSITSRPGFIARLKGKIEPKVTEAAAIEAVFARHGVPKSKVWGE
jgi:protoheme ferro-lyase